MTSCFSQPLQQFPPSLWSTAVLLLRQRLVGMRFLVPRRIVPPLQMVKAGRSTALPLTPPARSRIWSVENGTPYGLQPSLTVKALLMAATSLRQVKMFFLKGHAHTWSSPLGGEQEILSWCSKSERTHPGMTVL